MRYVNLGCGARFDPAWINIDLGAADPAVIQHNLATGIPLERDSCDLVYSSAVLEHMPKAAAAGFLEECHRVLRPGGVVRVGVPDLERLAMVYLSKLDAAAAGDPAAAADYDWIMLELFDQAVRERSGGAMLEFLRAGPPNRGFIIERIGEEGKFLLASGAPDEAGPAGEAGKGRVPPGVRRLAGALRRRLRRLWLKAVLRPEERRALEIGRFRLAGEVHQWMYDRFSLERLLRAVGFEDVARRPPGVSRLPDFADYGLEVADDGAIIKPDLLFMEGVKPSRRE